MQISYLPRTIQKSTRRSTVSTFVCCASFKKTNSLNYITIWSTIRYNRCWSSNAKGQRCIYTWTMRINLRKNLHTLLKLPILLKKVKLKTKSALSWCRSDLIRKFGTLTSMRKNATNVKMVKIPVIVAEKGLSTFSELMQTLLPAILTAELKNSKVLSITCQVCCVLSKQIAGTSSTTQLRSISQTLKFSKILNT